jgi:hypothetical protein
MEDTPLRVLAGKCFFFSPKSFLCDQGSLLESFDGTVSVPPAIYSIPTRVRTMIATPQRFGEAGCPTKKPVLATTEAGTTGTVRRTCATNGGAALGKDRRLAMRPTHRYCRMVTELYRIAGLDPNVPPPSYKEFPRFSTAESWERLHDTVEKALRTGTPYELDLEIVVKRTAMLQVASSRYVARLKTSPSASSRKQSFP